MHHSELWKFLDNGEYQHYWVKLIRIYRHYYRSQRPEIYIWRLETPSASFIIGVKKLTIMAGTTDISGHYDGPFPLMLFSNPYEMQLLAPNYLIVADYSNSRLQILDMTTNTSFSICTGVRGYENGNYSTCQLNFPLALTWIHDTLYVVEFRRIRSLNYKKMAGYSSCYQYQSYARVLQTTNKNNVDLKFGIKSFLDIRVQCFTH